MRLKDVLALGVPALCLKGLAFLDGPNSPRRYVEIKHVTDPLESFGEPDEYRVRRYATPPDGFPENGWLPLGE